jgi:hypothetical protein
LIFEKTTFSIIFSEKNRGKFKKKSNRASKEKFVSTGPIPAGQEFSIEPDRTGRLPLPVTTLHHQRNQSELHSWQALDLPENDKATVSTYIKSIVAILNRFSGSEDGGFGNKVK